MKIPPELFPVWPRNVHIKERPRGKPHLNHLIPPHYVIICNSNTGSSLTSRRAGARVRVRAHPILARTAIK